MDFYKHETCKLEIKPNIIVDVDPDIIWLLKWLNSFKSVETLYSCQGKFDLNFPAYVMFKCEDIEELNEILKKVTLINDGNTIGGIPLRCPMIRTDCEYRTNNGFNNYSIHFESQKLLDKFKYMIEESYGKYNSIR